MMNMGKPPKAAPYKHENVSMDHEYEVLKSGEIKITQKAVSISYWKARDFVSLIREHEESLRNTEYNISKEFQDIMLKQKNDINKELEKLAPYVKDAEEKSQIAYEKERLEGLTINMAKAVNAKEFNEVWFQNVWFRVKPELQKQVLENSTNEDRAKLAKIMVRFKRKVRG